MTRYTESIRANANKIEKEQLTSLMEKFDLSLEEAYHIIREEFKTDSTNLFEAYWELDRKAKRGTFQVGGSSF